MPVRCQRLLVVLVVLVSWLQLAQAFAGITNTRCNTDPTRGELNDPCGTLYSAVCGGAYCRCPEGKVVDINLHACVTGGAGGAGGAGGGGGAGGAGGGGGRGLFDDLPFDYIPTGQAGQAGQGGQVAHPTTRNPATTVTGDVSSTRCSRANDPCASLYRAVCAVDGYCVCPKDTQHHPTVALCIPMHNHDDHDHHDHDDEDDDDDTIFRLFSAASRIPATNTLLFCKTLVVSLGFARAMM